MGQRGTGAQDGFGSSLCLPKSAPKAQRGGPQLRAQRAGEGQPLAPGTPEKVGWGGVSKRGEVTGQSPRTLRKFEEVSF